MRKDTKERAIDEVKQYVNESMRFWVDVDGVNLEQAIEKAWFHYGVTLYTYK